MKDLEYCKILTASYFYLAYQVIFSNSIDDENDYRWLVENSLLKSGLSKNKLNSLRKAAFDPNSYPNHSLDANFFMKKAVDLLEGKPE